MNFDEAIEKARKIRNLYDVLEEKKYGKKWERKDLVLGFVHDVGDLVKTTMMMDGTREEIPESRSMLSHELSDCLWSILILADKYDVDIKESFIENMHLLEQKLIEEKSGE